MIDQPPGAEQDGDDEGAPGAEPARQQTAPSGTPFRPRRIAADKQLRMSRSRIGRRTREVDLPRGYVVRAAIPEQPVQRLSDVALGPTLRAAAMRRASRAGRAPLLPLQQSDLRRKVRAAKAPNLILFVVDASGSMAARQRMEAVKGAILSLLLDAYQKRDRVGLIAFRGTSASLILPPTNSVLQARRHLEQLPTGGRTPLVAGLDLAYTVLHQHTRRAEAPLPLLVLLTDGRANADRRGPSKEAHSLAYQSAAQLAHRGWSSLIIDCESGFPRLGLAQTLAVHLDAPCYGLDALSANALDTVVRDQIGQQHSTEIPIGTIKWATGGNR